MLLVDKPVSREDIKRMAEKSFGNLVKAVVDTSRGVMVVGASLHADEEALLLADGSVQADLWGINLYPDQERDKFIEFDSMINVRPGSGNITRGIDDPKIRDRIRSIVDKLVR